MINPKLGYSDEAAALLARQHRTIKRRDFRLDEAGAAECILQTYDLFGLPRPQHVVWVTDTFDERFRAVAVLFEPIGPAEAAMAIKRKGSAWAAGMRRLAQSALAAALAAPPQVIRVAMFIDVAIDFDFICYAYTLEYCENPAAGLPPNDHDRLYLEYCELLMQAAEYGAGYRVEGEDTLYIAPMPLTRFDAHNRFHCEDGPAVYWKGGHELYCLKDRIFDKALWQKIVSQDITAEEVMKINSADRRAIAISMLKHEEMLKQLDAELIDTGAEGTKLYRCSNFMGTGRTEYCMTMVDHSTPRVFLEFVPPQIGEKGDAVLAQAAAWGISKDEYLSIEARG